MRVGVISVGPCPYRDTEEVRQTKWKSREGNVMSSLFFTILWLQMKRKTRRRRKKRRQEGRREERKGKKRKEENTDFC